VITETAQAPPLPLVSAHGNPQPHPSHWPEMATRDTEPADAWAYSRPPVLVPVPAADVHPLTNQRLVVHDPERKIWRYGLRALTEPHPLKTGSKVETCVGVVGEGEWYRKRRDPNAIVVPNPIQLAWLYVEQPMPDPETELEVPDQSDVSLAAGHARDLVSDPSRPPVRRLQPALEADVVHIGARVCLMTPRGPAWDLRVCGTPRLEPFVGTVDLTGGLDRIDHPPKGPKVPLCAEADWYSWEQTGRTPVADLYWLRPVWLE
jgi:hypothetical protein